MAACPKCGYELSPFDTDCPRCRRTAQTPCAVCGQMGAGYTCDACHKEICARCAETAQGRTLCRTCASREQTARREPGAGVQRGTLGPAVKGGWGFFDSVSRAFTFIGASMRMVFRDKDLILPSLLSILANGAFLGLVVLILWSTGSLEAALSDDESGGVAEAIVGAVVIFGSYLITYFFMAMTVHLVHVHLKGEDAQVGRAFADALKNAHAILALALVSTLVAIVTNAMRGRRGERGIGDLVAGIIERLWTVATFLLLPIIILEDRGLRRALGRARDIHRRGLIGIAVGEIGVGLVAGVLGFVGFLIALFVGFGVFRAGLGIIAAIVVAGLLVGIVFAFTQFVRTAYYTCLYEWAAAREELGEAAPVPAPLAPALA